MSTKRPAPEAPDAADARLAKRIAARLFTCGSGAHADNLRLMLEKQYLGGWCEMAVVDVILDELRAAAVPATILARPLTRDEALRARRDIDAYLRLRRRDAARAPAAARGARRGRGGR